MGYCQLGGRLFRAYTKLKMGLDNRITALDGVLIGLFVYMYFYGSMVGLRMF